MDSIERTILYLRGLIDGGGYNESSKEGRIFNAVADSLEAISDEIELMHRENAAVCVSHKELQT